MTASRSHASRRRVHGAAPDVSWLPSASGSAIATSTCNRLEGGGDLAARRAARHARCPGCRPRQLRRIRASESYIDFIAPAHARRLPDVDGRRRDAAGAPSSAWTARDLRRHHLRRPPASTTYPAARSSGEPPRGVISICYIGVMVLALGAIESPLAPDHPAILPARPDVRRHGRSPTRPSPADDQPAQLLLRRLSSPPNTGSPASSSRSTSSRLGPGSRLVHPRLPRGAPLPRPLSGEVDSTVAIDIAWMLVVGLAAYLAALHLMRRRLIK